MREPAGRIRRVGTRDAALCVESTGTGVPVVMLHGFTGDAESMAPAADALGGAFEVHRVELVGHGRSDAPDDVRRYSMPACVAQIGDVLDALALESAHVYGYSMGARAALSLAVAMPARVRSLLLVGATAGLESEAERAARVSADAALAARIESFGLEAFVDAWMASPIFASQRRLGSEALARSREQRLRGSARGFALSLRGMGTGSMPPLHEALPKLAVPTRLVVGAEDAKFQAIAHALARALPEADVAVVPDAGHAAHIEQPAHVGGLAARFFRSVDARARAGAPASEDAGRRARDRTRNRRARDGGAVDRDRDRDRHREESPK